jgi:hypothetical protein
MFGGDGDEDEIDEDEIDEDEIDEDEIDEDEILDEDVISDDAKNTIAKIKNDKEIGRIFGDNAEYGNLAELIELVKDNDKLTLNKIKAKIHARYRDFTGHNSDSFANQILHELGVEFQRGGKKTRTNKKKYKRKSRKHRRM